VLALRHPSNGTVVTVAPMARKRPAPKPKYTGALAQPIYVDFGLLDLHRYPDVEEAFKEMWQTRVAEKMPLLFKHYKIDQSDELGLQRLAIILACEYVPGLRLAKRPKPGRKPTWKTVPGGLGGLDDELVRAVQDVKSQTGMRTQDAIRKLQKDKPGKWGRYTVPNLGARYREAKRRQEQFRKLVEEARELRARGQTLDGLLGLLLTDEN
jgi:hypothetical protein